jgi:hypothetical protein
LRGYGALAVMAPVIFWVTLSGLLIARLRRDH